MQSVADRRSFVRHMFVGLPVIAGTTSSPRLVHGLPLHEAAAVSTPVDTTLRALAHLHNDMRRRDSMTADDVGAVSMHVRALAAERLVANRDIDLMRGIRQVVAKEGRDVLIDQRSDPDRMRDELVAFGFDLRNTPPPFIDRDRRGEALDRLARSGLTPAYADAISELDDYQLQLMLAGGSVCSTLKEMERMLESMTAVMCMLAMIFPPAAPECFAASSVLASMKLISLFAC